jgi:glutathione S-transferase
MSTTGTCSRVVANVIVFPSRVGPRVMGLAPDEAAIEAAMPKARAVFDDSRGCSAGNPSSPAKP